MVCADGFVKVTGAGLPDCDTSRSMKQKRPRISGASSFAKVNCLVSLRKYAMTGGIDNVAAGDRSRTCSNLAAGPCSCPGDRRIYRIFNRIVDGVGGCGLDISVIYSAVR